MSPMEQPVIQDLDTLIDRARSLAAGPERRLLGIAGPPGGGKSTLAARIAEAVGEPASIVPMDGFHLADDRLRALRRRERKGAIDTFDGAGYVHLLRRLRDRSGVPVYAPEFRREIEDPIAGAIAVDPAVTLIITEGNYLLAEQPPWDQVRGLLDEAWFYAPDDELRIAQLIERHIMYGKTPSDAAAWALGPDQRNTELVAGTRHRADVIVSLPAI